MKGKLIPKSLNLVGIKVKSDFLSTINSNLDDRDAVTDLFVVADIGRTARRIVKCNKDTLNTPYKAGLTSGIDTGTAIISMGSINYGVIFYLPDGGTSTAPYICKKTNGAWGDWTRLTTNADIAGHLYFSVNGPTAMDSGAAGSLTRYRLQINNGGDINIYKSTDGGKTWPGVKKIASYEA